MLKLDDPKWNNVNVVTSLLKSFFRKLPNPIFTTEMYNIFFSIILVTMNMLYISVVKMGSRSLQKKDLSREVTIFKLVHFGFSN